jgi:ABC-type uncharacterized transport system involved in gliding motility auxiliary subunit
MQGKRVNTTKAFFMKFYKFGVTPLIFALTLLIGLVVLNYLTAIWAPSYDLTDNKINTLSYETKKLLSELDNDVTIKVFYPRMNQRLIRLLIEKYQAETDHILVEYIDPLRNPRVAEEYGVTVPHTIVIEGGGNTTTINPTPSRSHSEREITVGLYRLTAEQDRIVYFTAGHGELDPNNTGPLGLSILKERLTDQNYQIEQVNLLEEARVPEDCTVLIIAGPKEKFTDVEARMINLYITAAGSILLMADPEVDLNLDSVLSRYSLALGDNYIYETSNRLTTEQFGPISPLSRPAPEPHEITSNLPNQTFMMPYVRSIDSTGRSASVTNTPLLVTSEDSWAESDLESASRLNQSLPSRDDGESKGPITIATVSERSFDMPDSLYTRQKEYFFVRSGFVGTSSFAMNNFVTLFAPNENLFLNMVNWITRNDKVMDIMPHTVRFTPVELTRSEQKRLTWFTLFLLPAAIIGVGIVIMIRRR